ncbi:fumarylacetoacetate hydrolase family protein [Streptomyces sp. 5-10]|uniref:2-keto-4-pentenoate hydratase n=1 Tax=Streptomyces sp. 5-10 TaxID=878925 RepID=UPI00295F4338|nr:fumarylacetoacetate hydrolase family protein [Streptomyces sp. 5-10]
MKISAEDIVNRAKALYEARAARDPIAPFTDADPTLGMEDGYAIQRELVAMLAADGDRVVGYKAGLTSAPMQNMFGVDTPDYGPVLASTVHPCGASVSRDDFISPKVEAEIVFRLGAPLKGPGVTVREARGAIAEVMAGLEIVDSRIEHWRIRLADTIADLASNGAVVLAPPVTPAADCDFRLIGMAFSHNGECVATGAGAAALGDPVAVVAWLANVLGEHGVTLGAGQLVMTGALHAAVSMDSGDTFVAEFDRLGAVTMRVDGTRVAG